MEKYKIAYKIIKESAGILLITSVLTTLSGISIEAVQAKLFLYLPFLIILPSLNDMIGDFGSTIALKFSSFLYLGQITDKHWYHTTVMKKLMWKLTIIAAFSGVFLAVTAFFIAVFKGFEHDFFFAVFFLVRLIMATVLTTFFLLLILIFVSTLVGWYLYKHDKDPDNYLMPIATSIADIGTMVLFALTIHFLF